MSGLRLVIIPLAIVALSLQFAGWRRCALRGAAAAFLAGGLLRLTAVSVVSVFVYLALAAGLFARNWRANVRRDNSLADNLLGLLGLARPTKPS